MYDICGDIHGHADRLYALLDRLGYRRTRGAYRFPRGERQVLFVGDLIDRGPQIVETVATVRAMVDAGSAAIVCGNHEYNALAYHNQDEQGAPLRSHNPVHVMQHAATVTQYAPFPERWKSDLAWFSTLPLFFENEHLRVVHAAWDERIPAEMARIGVGTAPLADRRFLVQSAQRGTAERHIINVLLKGVEIRLPGDLTFRDKEGAERTRTRVKWWIGAPTADLPLRDVAMPPADALPTEVMVPPESLQHLRPYTDARPLFCGHYWLQGSCAPWTDRVACVDYSVANGGVLCAYRYDGELPLTAARYVTA